MKDKYMSDETYEKKLLELQRKNELIVKKRKLRDEKYKYNIFYNLFKGMKTSNKILFITVLAIISFTACCMYIQYSKGMEISSTLITVWYSFWTVEIISIAGIKVSKVKNSYNQDNDIDDDIHTV